MRLKAKDASGATVAFDFDDNRLATIKHLFDSNPGILGHGAGGQFGKSKASDATEAQAFSVSQLAYVEAKTYMRQYQPRMFEKLMPGIIDYSAGPWAQTVEYEITDDAGMGKFINSRGTDIPMVDSASARKSFSVALGGIGYDYTTEDLRISAYLQRPLPERKQIASMNGYLNHLNAVALTGDAAKNFTGLLNNGSITAANRPSGAPWATTATADQIITDFQFGYAAVQAATLNNSFVTKLALPILAFQALLKPRSTQSDKTVLQFLKESYPDVEITSVVELASLGNGRGVFYTPIDENMTLKVPMPLQYLAPQFNGLRVVVPGEYKIAGLEWRRILTGYYMNGLNS